jgi:hypothetical protein
MSGRLGGLDARGRLLRDGRLPRPAVRVLPGVRLGVLLVAADRGLAVLIVVAGGQRFVPPLVDPGPHLFGLRFFDLGHTPALPAAGPDMSHIRHVAHPAGNIRPRMFIASV